jgi:hypothetical protein
VLREERGDEIEKGCLGPGIQVWCYIPDLLEVRAFFRG